MSKPIWEQTPLPGSLVKNRYRALLTNDFRLYCIKTGPQKYSTWMTYAPNGCIEAERTVWQPAAFTAESDVKACAKSAALIFEHLFDKQEIIELLVQKTGELGGVNLCKHLEEKMP